MSIDKYYAYLIGVYLSDGSIFKKNSGYVFSLSSIDEDYIDYTKLCLDKVIGKSGSKRLEKLYGGYSKPNSQIYRLRCYSKDLVEDLWDKIAEKREIPEEIKNGDIELKKELIAGLVDGDGWVVFNVSGTCRGFSWQIGLSGNEELLNEVSKMCNQIGLKNWGPTKIKASKNTYRLFFDVLDFIKFKIDLKILRKKQRVSFIKGILNDYMLISKAKSNRILDVLDEDIVSTSAEMQR